LLAVSYGKLEWWGYITVKNVEDIFSDVDRLPACDGWTGGWTDILQRHSSRYAYMSRGKMCAVGALCI